MVANEMRDLIFRAWDNVDNKMIYDIYPAPYGDIAGKHNDRFMLISPAERIIIEQYSGVKDQFGTLIFEGDIVKYDNGTKAEVIFKDGSFMAFDGFANNSFDAYLKISPELYLDGHDFELSVIGNIHQNIDLININI